MLVAPVRALPMIFFLLLSLLGFFLSVIVHFSTFSSHPVFMKKSWPPYVGIFAVFGPMIFAQLRWGQWKMGRSFGDVPQWIQTLIGLGFGYAVLNFAVTALLD